MGGERGRDRGGGNQERERERERGLPCYFCSAKASESPGTPAVISVQRTSRDPSYRSIFTWFLQHLDFSLNYV